MDSTIILNKYVHSALLSLIYGIAGILHLISPELFMVAMPEYLPWHQEIIVITGVIEIALAFALLTSKRSFAAKVSAVYLVCLLPAHFHVSINQISIFGVDNPLWLWMRTAFQAVLITWSWWISSWQGPYSAIDRP